MLLWTARSLSAQVGYDPHHSPFRAIDHGNWLEAYSGHLYGNGGPIPLGPRDGNLFGARVDFRAQHALQLSLGAWVAHAVRTVIDANDSVATRIKAPVDQRVLGFETNLQFNLTGGKSWHRIAPYAGVTVGLAVGQATPASDTSGYAFGTKMFRSPVLGTRIFVGQRLFVKTELQGMIWKIQYPVSYSIEPFKQPGTVAAPNAVNPSGKTSDYALAPKWIFGIGWSW
jgi:hypothetical protein